ncbi:hypothetical protein CS238_05350 [Salmonella enterica]|nr:hypothetical protein [Salmonella enterica]EJC8747813.1 hypothetical protein [Salmonella enterica]HCM1648874.1 hypothetical protein [Salmonella enterica subsp. diarizonae serovar 48:i:z35]
MSSLSNEYQIVSTDSATNEYDEYEQSQSLDYKRLVGILNENESIVLPAIDKTIPIIFYNFSVWTKMKSRVNVFLQEPSRKTFFGKLTTSYQPGTESIYISMNLYEDKKKDKGINEYEVYKFLLASDCSHEEATNLVLLHEKGHAIHHQLGKRDGYLLDPTTPEASFLNPFFRSNEESVEKIPTVTAIAYKAITEGFADLYSCIIVDRLYDVSRSDVIINALYQYRTSHKSENYYSDPSIENYLNQRNGRDFKSFDEIYKYMSSTIAHTTVKNMGVKLLDGSEELGRFLGVVNILQGLNYRKIDKAVESIRYNYPFMDYVIFYADKKNPFSYHQNLFEEGCKAGEKWLKKKTKRVFKNKIKDIKRRISSNENELVKNKEHKRK